MWARFDEMRKLKQVAEEKGKSKKRKSLHGNNKAPLERRKRSLFSISPLSSEKAAGRGATVVQTCDSDLIGEFSSDDEQYPCLVAGSSSRGNMSTDYKHKSFQVTSHRPKKPVLSSTGKCGSVRLTTKLEDSASLIMWSDSDNEHDNLLVSEKVPIDTEQGSIGVFESPIKQKVIVNPSTVKDEFTSPVATENCPLSMPLSIKHENLKDENSKDTEFVPKPIDSSKKKRSKDVKGGLAEQCRKVIARERSDIVFWKHSLNVNKSELTASISNEEKPTLCLKVAHIESDFSLAVLKCYKLGDNSRAVYMILPISTISEHKIQMDDILEVYPPFRKILNTSTELPVILCAYYFKVASNSQEGFGISQMHIDFGGPESDTLESKEVVRYTNSCNPIGRLEEGNQPASKVETAFCNCSMSQPVTFCAQVIKSNLTTSKIPPIFNASCEESILDYVKKKCRETLVENAFELFLILKDRIGQFACLTLPLNNSKTGELCQLSETKGYPLVFDQFILTDIKSISCNPTLLPVLNSLHLDSRRPFLGDVCYMFANSEESAISLNENDLGPPQKSSDNLNSLLPSSQYQRVSFYAHCVCIVPGIHNDNPSSGATFSLFVVKCEASHQKDILQAINTKRSCNQILICIKKLSSCYVPEFVSNSFLERRKIFFFRDLLVHTELKHFVLDSLSRICIVDSEKNTEFRSTDGAVLYSTLLLSQEVVDTLYRENLKIAVNSLSCQCEEDTIVSVEGTISGLIDDSAVFWTVCGNCGLETKQPVTQLSFCCDSCQQHVKSNFHVQLEVNVDCKDVPGVQVTVKLLERTVFEYLPMEISDDFNGYDPECIIGKIFGRKLCHIYSITNKFDAQSGKASIVSIKLKEVMVAEGTLNYLEL